MRQEYEIIESLSHEFDVKAMCEVMGVSRSGYYDWRKRDRAIPQDRQRILDATLECHRRHPSHGYRWVHAYLEQHGEVSCSADYVRRAFNYLGIESQTRHKAKRSERRARDPYPNLIFSTWETVDAPRQVIVSDMTALHVGWSYWEATFCFDAFTKQIVGKGYTRRRGWPGQYYDSRDQAIERIEREAEGKLEPGSSKVTVFHTDQGSVYTSIEYNRVIKERGLVRSCSRAGKPTDSPVNESLNGWIKEELYIDFRLGDADPSDVPAILDAYVDYYNSERPCYSLGYMTPDAFYEAFMAGEVERRDTFRDRVLDPAPKFVRERRRAGSGPGGGEAE